MAIVVPRGTTGVRSVRPPVPMLKKIPISQLTVGMFVQALGGAWTEHPFWRSKFLVKDEAMRVRLLESGVPDLWIDTERGVAPPPSAPDGEASAGASPAAVEPASASPSDPATSPGPEPAAPAVVSSGWTESHSRASIEDELNRATGVVLRSRRAVLTMFQEARMGRALDARNCLPVVEEIGDSVVRNPGAVISLARLKTHDDYSYMHSIAACALMIALSRQMGHLEHDVREAGLAGLLHDIGKAVMPNAVLNKPGKLDEAEYRQMRRHPEQGFEMLREAGSASEATMDVVLHHHERMDGKGYPHGLPGESISLLARMGAVCDVYDAVTSTRPYKAPWDPSDALSRMAGWTPAHFDPVVFQAFVKALGIYPIGSLVRLGSGRLAVVVEQNPAALTSPQVRAFFSMKSNLHIAPVIIDLAASGATDRIVARESNRTWNFQNLDELWAGRDVLRKVGH